jgi:hypothetical protein
MTCSLDHVPRGLGLELAVAENVPPTPMRMPVQNVLSKALALSVSAMTMARANVHTTRLLHSTYVSHTHTYPCPSLHYVCPTSPAEVHA